MSRPADPSRPDLYARATQSIIAVLETGVRPWTKPWTLELLAGPVSRPLRRTGEPYSGIDVALRWSAAIEQGFAAPRTNARPFGAHRAGRGLLRRDRRGHPHGDASADYAKGSDHVQLPPFARFHEAEGDCATLAHKRKQWTRDPSRLDRDFGRKRSAMTATRAKN